MQFYTGDWMKDPALRMCPPDVRGVWVDMLCLMHESPSRGILRATSGKPISAEELRRACGVSTRQMNRVLRMLLDLGVCSQETDGAIFCRRMVREDKTASARSEAARKRWDLHTVSRDFAYAKSDAKRPSSSSSSVSASAISTPREISTGSVAVPCDGIGTRSGDEIAWKLAAELSTAHAKFSPGRAADARAVIERILGSAVNAESVAAGIRSSHALFMKFWERKRRENLKCFVPQLIKWLHDEDYLHPPPEDPEAAGPRLPSREEQEAAAARWPELERQLRES